MKLLKHGRTLAARILIRCLRRQDAQRLMLRGSRGFGHRVQIPCARRRSSHSTCLDHVRICLLPERYWFFRHSIRAFLTPPSLLARIRAQKFRVRVAALQVLTEVQDAEAITAASFPNHQTIDRAPL